MQDLALGCFSLPWKKTSGKGATLPHTKSARHMCPLKALATACRKVTPPSGVITVQLPGMDPCPYRMRGNGTHRLCLQQEGSWPGMV